MVINMLFHINCCIRVPDLDASLEEGVMAFRLLSRNQYNKALRICDKWSKRSQYHMHVKSMIYFLKAILTLEKVIISLLPKLN